MNILFINPKAKDYSRSVTVPLGLLSIASYLEQFGFSVRIFDRTVEKQSLEKVLEEFPTTIVGISLLSVCQYRDALNLSRFLHKNNVLVVWGGAFISLLPEKALNTGCVDAVSISEGEETWLDLARAKQRGQTDLACINGLALRDAEGKTFLTEQREFIDLSALPELDWSLVKVEKYFQTTYGCERMLYLYAAKGCPHNCAFCYNKEFHRCQYRKRPLSVLLKEIEYLVKNHGMDGVYFADELFCRNVKEMHETCDALKSLNLDFVWGGQTRIGMFRQEDFEYMYRAGCRWIFFGVESGSKRMLKAVNKHIDFNKIEQTFKCCKRAGIVTIGSFIIGLPDETTEDLRETVALIERLETSLINLNWYIVVPGSDFHTQLVSQGKYPEDVAIKQLEKDMSVNDVNYNFSNVPMRDLKVVRNHYMWRSFSANKITIDGKKFSFTKKVIVDALKSVRSGNFKEFIISSADAGKQFIEVFFYAHFFPKIKKKYGIGVHSSTR